MEKDVGPTLTQEQVADQLRQSKGNQSKNNPGNTPQADADNGANAGGQVDLKALKDKIANPDTPSNTVETRVPDPDNPTKTDQPVEDKLLAGKFKTQEDLEEGYNNLESKLGQKANAEKLGEMLVQYSGRDIEELTTDLQEAIKTNQAPTRQETNTEQPHVDTQKLSEVEKKVKALEASQLQAQFDRESKALVEKYPDAEGIVKTLEDIWKFVDTKKSLEQIYEERFKPVDQANQSQKIDEDKTLFQAESSLGKDEPKIGDINPNDLTVEQLRQVLPKKQV